MDHSRLTVKMMDVEDDERVWILQVRPASIGYHTVFSFKEWSFHDAQSWSFTYEQAVNKLIRQVGYLHTQKDFVIVSRVED